jgi:hypothetical protein
MLRTARKKVDNEFRNLMGIGVNNKSIDSEPDLMSLPEPTIIDPIKTAKPIIKSV